MWFIPQARNLDEVLKEAFNGYGPFRDSISIGITKCSNYNDLKAKFQVIVNHRNNNMTGICGHHLVMTHLTRNFFSHREEKIELEFWVEIFPEIYKNLIFTLLSLYIKKYL